MTKRPTLLRRILSRLAGQKKEQQLAKPTPPEERPKRQLPSIEPLEGRIAPAILLNPTTVQYKDTQGDLVTVTFSKALFGTGNTVDTKLAAVFKFDTGSVSVGGSTATAQELQILDLTKVADNLTQQDANIANGVSITITATPQNGVGDGVVNIGYIKANLSAISGITLGKVYVDGDLGRIDAGVATKPIGLNSLVVNSLGAFSTTTQGSGGSLNSTLYGAVGSIEVNHDVKDVIFTIANGNVVNGKTLAGNLGKLTIHGKLSVTPNLAVTNAGSFSVDGNLGSLLVGSTSGDGIFGGSSQGTGRIAVTGAIGAVVINGDVRGSAGKDSGQIAGGKGIGDVKLQYSLFAGSGEASGRIVSSLGSIGNVSLLAIRGESAIDGGNSGAAGKNSASISAAGGIASLTLTGAGTDGKIAGGAGEGSGSVSASGGSIGKIVMNGSLEGGAGLRSGRIFAAQDISTATLKSVLGAGGAESGVLRAGDDFGVVNVFAITGGGGTESGVVRAGDDVKSLTVQTVVTGGSGTESGSIRAGDLMVLTVKNSASAASAITAGTGLRSGYVAASATAGKIFIQGSLDGSTASAKDGAGSISITGNVASVSIAGNLTGGVADSNGAVVVNGNVAALSIAGNLTGGAGNYSGGVAIGGAAASIVVNGGLTGGSGLSSASIIVGADFAKAGDLKSLVIKQSVVGGAGINSALINATGTIAKAVIGDSSAVISDTLKGGIGGGSGGVYAAQGIGSLTVFGNVSGGDGRSSGSIRVGGLAKSISVSGGIAGGLGIQSGSVRVIDQGLVAGRIGSLKLQTLTGSSGNDSGQIWADGAIDSLSASQVFGGAGLRTGSVISGFGVLAGAEGIVKLGGIASMTVSGSIQVGAGNESGSVIAAGTLKSVKVAGGMIGSTVSAGRDIVSLSTGSLQGVSVRAVGSAAPTTKDVAISKITVLGDVENISVLAGYDRYANPVNGDAQIGTISVIGDWTGSSVAAGVRDVNADGFGNADDIVISNTSAIVSKIASILIGGELKGRADASQVGFVAQQIDSITIGGSKVPLTSAKNTIVLPTSLNEITVREVA